MSSPDWNSGYDFFHPNHAGQTAMSLAREMAEAHPSVSAVQILRLTCDKLMARWTNEDRPKLRETLTGEHINLVPELADIVLQYRDGTGNPFTPNGPSAVDTMEEDGVDGVAPCAAATAIVRFPGVRALDAPEVMADPSEPPPAAVALLVPYAPPAAAAAGLDTMNASDANATAAVVVAVAAASASAPSAAGVDSLIADDEPSHAMFAMEDVLPPPNSQHVDVGEDATDFAEVAEGEPTLPQPAASAHAASSVVHATQTSSSGRHQQHHHPLPSQQPLQQHPGTASKGRRKRSRVVANASDEVDEQQRMQERDDTAADQAPAVAPAAAAAMSSFVAAAAAASTITVSPPYGSLIGDSGRHDDERSTQKAKRSKRHGNTKHPAASSSPSVASPNPSSKTTLTAAKAKRGAEEDRTSPAKSANTFAAAAAPSSVADAASPAGVSVPAADGGTAVAPSMFSARRRSGRVTQGYRRPDQEAYAVAPYDRTIGKCQRCAADGVSCNGGGVGVGPCERCLAMDPEVSDTCIFLG